MKNYILLISFTIIFNNVNCISEFLWKFLGGSKFSNPPPIFQDNLENHTHTHTWSGGRCSSACSKMTNSSFICFGGYSTFIGKDLTGHANDLWEFEINNVKWEFLGGSNVSRQLGIFSKKYEYNDVNWPGSRKYSTGCTWMFGSDDPKLVVFGGYGGNNFTDNGRLNDLWFYSKKRKQWMWESGSSRDSQMGSWGNINEYDESNILPSRDGHKMFKIDEIIIVIFGYFSGFLNDVWFYDLIKMKWKYVNGNPAIRNDIGHYYTNKHIYHINNIPGSRENYAGYVHPKRNIVIIQGGYGLSNISSACSGLWLWEYGNPNDCDNTPVYTEFAEFDPSNVPIAVDDHVALPFNYFDDDYGIMIVGGTGYQVIYWPATVIEYTNKLWIYSFKQRTWTWVAGDSTQLVPLPVYDSKYGSIIGGRRFSYADEFDVNGTSYVLHFGGRGCVSDTGCEYGRSNDIFIGKFSEKCFGKFETDPSVCSGHGKCIESDLCICKNNYYGEQCEINKCLGLFSNSSRQCLSRGECISYDLCSCINDYSGDNCQFPRCYTSYANEEFVCTSKNSGECVRVDTCICKYGFSGKECEKENLLLRSLVEFWYFYLVIIPLIALTIFFTIFIIFIIVRKIIKAQKRLNTFSGLGENIDILLEEQKVDEQYSASLKINKSLFSLNFDDIDLLSPSRTENEYGSYYLVNWKGRKAELTIFKRLGFTNLSQSDHDKFEKEVSMLISNRHPHILKCFGIAYQPNRVGMLTQFCERGNLEIFLTSFQSRNNILFPLNERIRILGEIVSSMAFLSRKNIIHRNLNPQCILVTKDYKVQLSSFALSRCYIEDNNKKRNITRFKENDSIYQSPEIFLGKDYGKQCDVYSFAMICYTCVTNSFDYGKNDYQIKLKMATKNLRPPIILHMFKGCKWLIEIIRSCWSENIHDRLSFDRLNTIFTDKINQYENKIHNKANNHLKGKSLKSNYRYDEREKNVNEINKIIKVREKVLLKKKKEIQECERKIKQINQER